MWSFIAGFLVIPYMFVLLGFYGWLTYSAEGDGNFMRGMIIGGAFLILITAIILSMLRVK